MAEAGASTSKSHFIDGVIDLMAGTLGGVANAYVGQPLDTVKVKMQTFSHLYRNSVDCFVQTLTQQGIRRGLYAGTVPALAANVGENAILFCAYGACQKLVCKAAGKQNVSHLSVVENALAGSGAAFFASFVLCPTELIKCKLQAMRETQNQNASKSAEGVVGQPKKLIGPFGLTKQIVRTEGILGLFRGLTPTFAREVPGYFFFFGGYEIARNALTPEGKTKEDIGMLRTVLCGGIGGVSLWLMIFPADVIKSKIQVQGSGSFLGVGVQVFKQQGIRGLYKGLAPSLVRSFFATGSLFLAFETSKRFMHDFAD